MIHTLTTTPSVEPVTLAEMRAHLGISDPAETSRDAIITGRIVTARTMAEHFTRRALITQTWTGYADGFDDVIALRGPLQSVSSIQYVDDGGALQTLAPSAYDVDTSAAVVVPAWEQQWPSVRAVPRAVRVTYVAGYGNTAASVPEPIKDAIRFMVGQWELFQSSIEGQIRPMTMPNAAKELLSPYIDYREIYA